MDPRCDSNEVLFEFKEIGQYSADLPLSILVSGIHKAILTGDLDDVRRLLDSGASVNETTQYGFTPLHMAVIKNDSKKLEYLLSRDGVELDARCSRGKTPLHTAAGLGRLESVERLVRAGCDVNLPDNNDDPPLHVSVYNPEICHLLIRSGAQVDAVDKLGATVLHRAVKFKCHEVLSMLLYYNADANVTNKCGYTPFMAAMQCRNVTAQEVLLEYVDEFDNSGHSLAALCVALEYNSPLTVDLIRRGADVNYGDDPNVKDCLSAFNMCLLNPADLATFEAVWERLRYNESKTTIDLLNVFEVRNVAKVVPTLLQVIIESHNFEPAVKFFGTNEHYFQFVRMFAGEEFDPEQLSALTCRLLWHGFRATSHDVYIIFAYYGDCELLRLLLYMDNDYEPGWLPDMILPRIKFDIGYDIGDLVEEVDDVPKEDVLELLRFFVHPPLVAALRSLYGDDERFVGILNRLPRVPSLLQLARDPARRHIRDAFNATTTCQFYTTIDHLYIPNVYKKILTFERELYAVERDETEGASD